MIKPAKKPVLQTTILCLITLLLTFPKNAGFMLGLVLLLLIPSFLKSIYYIFIKNKEQKQRSIQSTLWLVTCSAVIINHVYLHKTTRVFAEQVSDSIVAYHKLNGEYPNSVNVLNFDQRKIEKYRLHYFFKNNQPYLFYPATWIIYDTYMFNFKNNEWVFQ